MAPTAAAVREIAAAGRRAGALETRIAG
jgi:hypothetical protein